MPRLQILLRRAARGWAAGLTFFGVLLLAAPASAVGLLLPTDASLPPLAIESHHTTIEVTDQASVTRTEQVFLNHTDRPLEAVFYFPVPRGGAVSDLNLWINGQKTPGAVLEKDKARQIYQSILQRVQDPALIEYVDGQIFQARVFPIPPRGRQKIEITYATVLDRAAGMRRLVYPLRTGRAAAVLLRDFTLDIKIRAGAALGAIYSPSHRVALHRGSDHEAQVRLEQTGADLEEDFLLYIGDRDEEVGMSLLTYDKDGPGGEDGYFLMVLSPSLDQEQPLPVAVTFVVDTSGSMAGDKIKQARAALEAALTRLRPGDAFNVISFSTSTKRLFARPMQASPERVQQGLRFARDLEAAGGTAIDDALSEALRAPPLLEGATHYVIFVTDGRPTVGVREPSALIQRVKEKNQHQARLFTLGVGYDVNPVLLDAVADQHQGHSQYLRPGEDLELRISGLFQMIAWPSMTDLRLDYGTHEVHDVYPRRLPDLFRGSQVVVMGRTRGALGDTIKLEGRLGRRPVGVAFSPRQPSNSAGPQQTAVHDFIPQLWATRKVAYLLDEIRAQGEVFELKQEVVRLATTYGLVTPYTSFLAVDDSELERQRPAISYDFEDSLIEGHLLRPQGARLRDLQESSLGSMEQLKQGSGQGSVDFSIANNAQKSAQSRGESTPLRTRHIDGRLFVYRDGAWIQQGADEKKKQRQVKYMSPEYMKLIEENPKLRRSLSVGKKVTVDFEGEALSIY